MFRTAIVIVLSFLSANASFAETAVVRSAEHEGFVRVVLDLSNPSGVAVSQNGNSLQIELPKEVDRIESADFFRRISRDLVSSISVNNSDRRIDLSLACECRFESFVAGAKMLAIDLVADSKEQVDNVTAPVGFSWGLNRSTSDSNLTFGTSKKTVDEKKPVPEVEPLLQKDTNIELPLIFSRREDKIDNFSQERMLSNLADSAEHVATGIPSQEAEGSDQIVFHSNDLIQSKALPEIEQNAQMILGQCDHHASLNPVNWPNYEDARSFLSAARSDAGSGDIELRASVKRTLAGSYLSLGMGAEARALMRAIENPTAQDKDLIILAKAIDGDELTEPLSGAHCPDLVVWQLLLTNSGERENQAAAPLSDANLKKIRSDFDRWPTALQGIFAAKLAERLLTSGAADAAAFSLRRSESAPEQRTGERALAAAELANKTQGSRAAVKLLEPIVSTDSDTAPEAAIALTEIVIAQNKPLKPSQKAALETYREEYEGTELEEELLRARLRAAIQEDDFKTISELMPSYAKLARPSQVNLILDEIGEAIATLKSDAAFLKEAVSLTEQDFNNMAEALKKQIKSRVVALGFPDLAAQLGSARAKSVDLAAQAQQNEVQPKIASEQQDDSDSRTDPLEVAVHEDAKPATTEQMTNLLADTPISKAVRDTQSVLDEVTSLKDELAELGL